MKAIDSSMLLMFFRPAVAVPHGADGRPISAPKARIRHFVDSLEKEGARLLIPTPVLSEILIKANSDQFQEIIRILDGHRVFRVEEFDVRAAQELAIMTRKELGTRAKRLTREETAAKVRLDRQIVAIAKVNDATTIYSDDEGLRAFARRHGITPIGLAELPLPEAKHQIDAFPADGEE